MAKSKRKPREVEEDEAQPSGLPRGWAEFLGVALLAIGGLMLGGLCSYQFGEGDLMGPAGRLVAGALYAGFGMASYLVVLGVGGIGVKSLVGARMELRVGEGVGFATATMAGCVLLHVLFPDYRVQGYTAGGLSGELLGEVSLGLFDHAGTYLIASTLLIIGLVASTPLTFRHLLQVGTLGYRVVGMVSRYLWGGLLGIIRAQRAAREQETEFDDERAEGDDEGEDEGGDDELEEEDEEEDDEEDDEEEGDSDAEEEGDEDEDECEDDDDETLAEVALPPRARGSAPPNRKRTRPAELGTAAAMVAAGGSAAVGEARPGGRKRALAAIDAANVAANVPVPSGPADSDESPSELPEIVDRNEDLLDALRDEEDGEGDGGQPGDKDVDPRRKKPPLRLEELAAARAKQAAAAAAAAHIKAVGAARVQEGAQRVTYLNGTYQLPPLELFAAAQKTKIVVDKDHVYAQADRIVQALAQFKIKGKVTKVHPGPVITRYEFKPEAGVKVSRIQNLENDLAMALEAVRIRILAPIPGKSSVGLEVPNKERETVFVQENLADPDFSHGKALPLVLGKNIVGKTISIDLAKSPHLLVAGATGSGKSVGVNSMLCSLLYTRTPEELRMILIDPKMLEFSVYRDIPHLLLPVITDAEKANLALRWTVNEMERRYAVLSEAGVRNLEGFNEKVPELQAQWDMEKAALDREAAHAARIAREEGEEALPGSMLAGLRVAADGSVVPTYGGTELEPRPETMPYIVVVIDEFADLMMVASKEVEANVSRIAAKARAAGIHLIVATQRPSVDVITGTIKNNFPSRIAFQVTSDVDSRTILDQKGAKQLLGMGDMLYMDRGKEPSRVHGCFVSEQEIEKVVDFVQRQAKPGYNMEITRSSEDGVDDDDEDRPNDPLYDRAVAIVAETQKVSTSMIQRRLNVGYNRAAKIVERMEVEGVIGPLQGSKPRDVYVSAA